MKRLVAATLATAIAIEAGAQTPAPKRDLAAQIETELRAVARAAGDEFSRAAVNLCMNPPIVALDTTDREPAYYSDGRTVRPDNSWYVEPSRVFDDLYFVGDNAASAWALTTPDGIILFDTNYPFWLDDVVIAGMKKAGLDPARIKYVLVSHAHGDHLGGAQILQSRYGARIVMGAADWDLVARYPQRYKNMSPRRDVAVTDSMPITLGGTIVRAVLTPGHTPGTLSFIFTAHDRGAPVTVAYAGGSGMNFPNTPASVGIPAYRTYAQSQQQTGQIAAAAGATVLISNHPWVDNALARIKLLSVRGAGKHPFDIGANGVQNFFRVAAGCARVAQLRLEQQQER